PITPDQVLSAFGRKDLLIFTDSKKLKKHLNNLNWENTNLLMMSSGTFEGMNLENLID
ncbi:MAG: peptidoglycan synthetase, partial [Flavobacteriales bacterium]|nr:peptidoglycan synthetase [Flavobacteriales bacterium]